MNATLAQMVSELEARFPNVGERAQKAAQWVEEGRVTPLGVTDGKTFYQVQGSRGVYNPTIEGGCPCVDAHTAAPKYNGKPLCYHRIAAMMAHKLAQGRIERLASIFRQADELGADEVRLRVRVGFTYNRKTEQGNTITGWIVPGQGRIWQTLEAPTEYAEINGLETEIAVTFAELEAALNSAGYRFETKIGAAGGYVTYANEVWYFRRQDERERKLGGPLATKIGAVAA